MCGESAVVILSCSIIFQFEIKLFIYQKNFQAARPLNVAA